MRYIILKDGRYELFRILSIPAQRQDELGRNETGGNEDGEIAGVGDVLLVGGENGRLDEVPWAGSTQ